LLNFTFHTVHSLKMSSASWPCEDEAQKYMEEHKIVELLDNLTAQVVFHRPSTHSQNVQLF